MSRLHIALIGLGLAIATAAVIDVGGEGAQAGDDTGTITGTVTFTGKAPARKPIDRSSDPFCAKTKALSEDVLVDDGKLADVHVRIKAGEAPAVKVDSAPVVITQTGCMYRPRVAGVVAGQEVWIVNGDSTMHNVHGRDDDGTWFNRSQPAKAPTIKRKDTAGKAGQVLTLKCDVHPWMRAFLPVTDHALFDVTGKDGTFEITGVPKGKSLTLEAWHPKYGLKTKKARAGANVTFSFP